jgi:hypothetical protein
LFGLIALPTAPADEPPAKEPPAATKPKYANRTLRGRVVFVAEALARRFGIKSVPEAADRGLALETAEGELVPLVEDVRGRAFRADERLRRMDLELLVRQYEGSPLVQVIDVFSLKKGQKYEVDYWCDVCSIAMYELKACECCQGETTLRERLVEKGKK